MLGSGTGRWWLGEYDNELMLICLDSWTEHRCSTVIKQPTNASRKYKDLLIPYFPVDNAHAENIPMYTAHVHFLQT
jgi:hypothetical protein